MFGRTRAAGAAVRLVRPWRRRGRAWRLGAVVGLVVAIGVAGAGTSSAAAPVTCSPGSELADGIGCINPTTGELTQLVYGGKVPGKMNKLSSELDAVVGNNGAASAGVSQASKTKAAILAGKSVGSRLLGVAGKTLLVGQAFQVGYSLGGAATSFACDSLGWSAFCDPSVDLTPDYVPNLDVTVGDPGWFGPVSGQTISLGAGVFGTFSVLSSAPSAGSVVAYGTSADFAQVLATGAAEWISAGSYSIGSNGKVCERAAGGKSGINVNPVNRPAQALPVGFVGSWGVYPCKIVGSADGTVPYGVIFYGSGAVGGPTVAGDGTIDFESGSNWLGYWLQGAPQRPADPDPDPLRHWETRIECKKADGTSHTVTGSSAEFHEGDSTWPAFPSVTCPDGEVPTKSTVWEVGGPGDRPVYEVEVPTEIQQAHQDYPQCAGGECLLTLWRVNGSTRTDCFEEAGQCEGWLSDPDRETKYACTYGLPGEGTDVPLSECYIYGPSFDPQQRARNAPYGDPSTGQAVPLAPDKPAEDTGGEAGGDSGPCWPSGWAAFNPAEWVLQPAKCALQWAFVPRAGVLAQALTQASTAAQSFAPIGYAVGAADVMGGIIGSVYSGGCSGDAWGVQPAYIVWPCEPPISGYGYIYAVMSVIVIGLGAWGAWAILQRAVEPR